MAQNNVLDASDIAELVEQKIKDLVSEEVDWMANLVLNDLEIFLGHYTELISVADLQKWVAGYRSTHHLLNKNGN